MANEKRLIDANELVYALYRSDAELHSSQLETSEIVDEITRAPTADAVEVVHGRWLDVKETEFYSPDHRCTFTHTAETCSNCKVRIGFIGSKQYLYDNQCPNCGAKMDGDGNG